jgi:hypothetical protein
MWWCIPAIPATLEVEVGGSGPRLAQGKITTPHLKKQTKANSHEVPNSNPSTIKKKRKSAISHPPQSPRFLEVAGVGVCFQRYSANRKAQLFPFCINGEVQASHFCPCLCRLQCNLEMHVVLCVLMIWLQPLKKLLGNLPF